MFGSAAAGIQLFNYPLADPGWLAQCMPPKAENAPPRCLECADCCSVAADITIDLCLPITPISNGHATMLWATVPETPIDENGKARAREREIGAAGKPLVTPPAGNSP